MIPGAKRVPALGSRVCSAEQFVLVAPLTLQSKEFPKQQAIWKESSVLRDWRRVFGKNAQRLMTYVFFFSLGQNIVKEPQRVSLPGLNTAYNKDTFESSSRWSVGVFPTYCGATHSDL